MPQATLIDDQAIAESVRSRPPASATRLESMMPSGRDPDRAISGAETNYIYAIQDVVSSTGAGEILINTRSSQGTDPRSMPWLFQLSPSPSPPLTPWLLPVWPSAATRCGGVASGPDSIRPVDSN